MKISNDCSREITNKATVGKLVAFSSEQRMRRLNVSIKSLAGAVPSCHVNEAKVCSQSISLIWIIRAETGQSGRLS